MEKSTVLAKLNKDEVALVDNLQLSVKDFLTLDALANYVPEEHFSDHQGAISNGGTPTRFVKAMLELLAGSWDVPDDVLSTQFDASKYDEIIYVNDISFVSMCAHHMLPFFGKAHFGYLPSSKIVGISKIPRLVEVYSRRPQVQEKLTCDIVDKFNEIIIPHGCGLVMEAYHLCMMIRGVAQKPAYTKTTALRGIFKTNESTKQEFLDGIKKISPQLWP